MQERTSLEDALQGIGKVERELEDNIGMIELGEAENDAGVVSEAEAALKDLKKEVARRELEALLSGEADRFDSYLEVHAGAGMDLEIGIEPVGLAREQRFQLAARHFLFEIFQRGLGLADHACIVLGLAELDHADVVFELALDLADALKRILQRGALLHQLLGLLGIVPEIGVFGELVQLGQSCRGFLDVKDASSAARPTA